MPWIGSLTTVCCIPTRVRAHQGWRGLARLPGAPQDTGQLDQVLRGPCQNPVLRDSCPDSQMLGAALVQLARLDLCLGLPLVLPKQSGVDPLCEVNPLARSCPAMGHPLVLTKHSGWMGILIALVTAVSHVAGCCEQMQPTLLPACMQVQHLCSEPSCLSKNKV